VPFVARYRKEATGGLDDTQLRTLDERLRYLRELEERRAAILDSIDEQGKLDDALRAGSRRRQQGAARGPLPALQAEAPHQGADRARGRARAAGRRLLADPTIRARGAPRVRRRDERAWPTSKAALEGARAILIERWGEDAALIGACARRGWPAGVIRAKVIEGKETAGAKFSRLFRPRRAAGEAPSHRMLALFRGETRGVPRPRPRGRARCADGGSGAVRGRVAARVRHRRSRPPGDRWLRDACRWPGGQAACTCCSTCSLRQARERRGRGDRGVRRNLRTCCSPRPPARARCWASIRAAHRREGRGGRRHRQGGRHRHRSIRTSRSGAGTKSIATLAALCRGTRSSWSPSATARPRARPTSSCRPDEAPSRTEAHQDRVSEAGASVYSASELAAKEFPDLDVSLRGAVSIARRLQDPLAELVKIEPKAIGVGQYQHDVDQHKLARALDARVEDCVNAVGVDVNTASAPLLARVSGCRETLAENIVRTATRTARSAPRGAEEGAAPRPQAFEQCAGFLRIAGGDEPLDASAVHPEAYPVVERIVAGCGRDIRALIGDAKALRALARPKFTDENASACRPCATSCASWKSPAATRVPPGIQDRHLRRRRRDDRRPASPA
jgi:protein Tex